jgi:hypothetical protein
MERAVVLALGIICIVLFPVVALVFYAVRKSKPGRFRLSATLVAEGNCALRRVSRLFMNGERTEIQRDSARPDCACPAAPGMPGGQLTVPAALQAFSAPCATVYNPASPRPSRQR